MPTKIPSGNEVQKPQCFATARQLLLGTEWQKPQCFATPCQNALLPPTALDSSHPGLADLELPQQPFRPGQTRNTMNAHELQAPVGSRPLRQVIPQLDRLLEQPAAFLEAHPVRIGPLRSHRLAVYLGLYFLLAAVYVLAGERQPLMLFFLFAVAPLLLLALLWPRRAALFLVKKGIAFENDGQTICCPWSLFSAPGQVFVRQAGTVQEMILPVDAASVARVFSSKDGRVLAQGQEVRTDWFEFLSSGELRIDADFEAEPRELGELLLRLGQTLGSVAATGDEPVPEVTSPADALDGRLSDSGGRQQGDKTAWFDAAGWLHVKLVRLAFPPHCCGCGRSTNEYERMTLAQGFRWFDFFASWFHLDQEQEASVSVPLCCLCQRRYHRRRFVRIGVKAMLGIVPLALLYLVAQRQLDVVAGCFWMALSLVAALAIRATPGFPFESRYDADQRTAVFNFWLDGYATRLVAHLKSAERPS
ncbi:MAG: hypothetical protein JNM56_10665 [Planctomycetia bacterium]|nr:hypothetical protein [Planctomycetia bacterium]